MQNLLLLKTKKVLFAEDDVITRNNMVSILEMLFEKVYVAADGEEAFNLYEDENPDLLITDIKMPKRDGISLIRRIRKNNYSLPIILMSSFSEQQLVLDAANLSIDGYLIKPVDLEAITSTIFRAIKRTHQEIGLIKLSSNIFYNLATKELFHKGEIIILGGKEQELLNLLLNNRHRTLSKEEIAQTLWPLDPICDSAIKNIILRLRKKIIDDIIISVRGIGYRLNTRNDPQD